ncbi:predicted protein [Plenodomus lingam JN3]|uniref:Predicted protein n=1 Tax=Leptosphaeria maculans (strain JN3 / isolate v23.1.3 / race Av1-4-5-6-7-8) TaxID=985895 RepID=E5A1J0_LEPMJ|nr:predicted protein [Plenodomus lingam JN3]CBX97454.1 predicted protein [Plenodomus lingam JN3]
MHQKTNLQKEALSSLTKHTQHTQDVKNPRRAQSRPAPFYTRATTWGGLRLPYI